jgi:hypothetical protein
MVAESWLSVNRSVAGIGNSGMPYDVNAPLPPLKGTINKQ